MLSPGLIRECVYCAAPPDASPTPTDIGEFGGGDGLAGIEIIIIGAVAVIIFIIITVLLLVIVIWFVRRILGL